MIVMMSLPISLNYVRSKDYVRCYERESNNNNINFMMQPYVAMYLYKHAAKRTLCQRSDGILYQQPIS